MITGSQVLLAILGIAAPLTFVYLMRRAAYRQRRGKGSTAK